MSYNYPATGYHHITACAGGAQEDVDFFTRRRRPAARQADRPDGRKVSALPPVLLECEHRARLDHDDVSVQPHHGPARIGTGPVDYLHRRRRARCLSGRNTSRRTRLNTGRSRSDSASGSSASRHPAGMSFEVMEDKDARVGWTTDQIGQGESVRGFHGTVLSVRDISEQENSSSKRSGFARPASMAGIIDSRSQRGRKQNSDTPARAGSRSGQLDVRRGHHPPYCALGGR